MTSDYMSLESPSKILQRSKSYENKLNIDTGESDEAESNNNEPTKKKDSNEPKIIVTSFAPNPRAKQTAQIVAVRTTSMFNSRSAIETRNKLASNENDDESTIGSRKLNVIWPDGKNNPPVIIFNPKVLRKTFYECKKIGEHYRLTYKFSNGEKKLIKAILDGHGFREAHPNSSEFNIIWTGNNLKTYAFRSLQQNQKVNHFPRSCEITRKDRLYKNVQRMSKEKGHRAFNFLPLTFVMPFEIDEFYNSFYRERGLWIVKPASLSRGRGIYLINHPDQIPLEDNLIVSKYISNPLLIEGFKFDLRLYVCVTSFDPLVFYLYEEGLTRFATVKYDQNIKNIKNTCMHLTNYSLNKKNDRYVHCNDPDVEDYGNKWSMGALLRFLFSQGKDTFSLMMNIEEIVIKTLLSVESPLASAARMFVPNRGNCFELFGFDILIDKDLKPWVIEVNLSPSLDCDALLDLKIKSAMVTDLFTLTGIYCQNPSSFTNRSRFQREQTNNIRSRNNQPTRIRPHSAHSSSSTSNIKGVSSTNDNLYDNISPTEQEILKTVIDESERSNSWVRLFPTSDTWEFYSQYLENRSTSYNMMLHKKLYPRRWQTSGTIKKATQSRSKMLNTVFLANKENIDTYTAPDTVGPSLMDALERYRKYERRLKDNVRANEETLRRFTHNFNIHQSLNNGINFKSNSNNFPNGDLKAVTANNKKTQIVKTSTDSQSDDDESIKNIAPTSKDHHQQQQRVKSSVRKQLPTLHSSNIKNDIYKRIGSSRPIIRKVVNNKDDFDSSDQSNDDDDDDDSSSLDNGQIQKQETKYDLDEIIKLLDNGYYISRIQIRNAFALYLFKIHVRLVSESQLKDDSNLQQMDLVMRFIKKAAPNLSQEFKVFVPSKRLPLCEQKRMLAKELHDFLHIYRKDTGLIRIDQNVQLELERKSKKNRHKLIDEKAFQALLYKCCEAELEEIMSIYMKNCNDSSVFLGASKNSTKNETVVDTNCFNLTPCQSNNENLTSLPSTTTTTTVKEQINVDLPKSYPTTLCSALSRSPSDLKERYKSAVSKQQQQHSPISKIEESETNKTKTPKKIQRNSTITNKKTNDEIGSELSCESFISNSSDEGSTKGGQLNFGYSRSLSRNSSTYSTAKRLQARNKSLENKKISGNIKLHREYSNKNENINKNDKKRKSIVKSAILNKKKIDQDSLTTQIYSNEQKINRSQKAKSSTTPTLKKTTSTSVHPISLHTSFGLADKEKDAPQSAKKLHQQLISISSGNSPNSTKDSKFNSNSVFIHRHTNSINASNTSDTSTTTTTTTTTTHKVTSFKDQNAEEYANLSKELRNLNLRQHERVYSAAKSSFRLASSLNSDDTSFSEMNRAKMRPLDDFSSSSSSNNNSNKNSNLIDHLERQKEKTSRLLQKSKAKHSEMISMSLIKN